MNAKQITQRLSEIEAAAVAAKATTKRSASISESVNGHRVCCIVSETRTSIQQEWMVDGRITSKYEVAVLIK